LAALVGPVHNIFFLTIHYFDSFAPIAQQAGQAAVQGRLSISMCLWGWQKKGRGKKKSAEREREKKIIVYFKNMNGQEEDKGKGKAGKNLQNWRGKPLFFLNTVKKPN
jgi:hypothetical protein